MAEENCGWTIDETEKVLNADGDKYEWRLPNNESQHVQETTAPGDLLIKAEDMTDVPRKVPSGEKGVQTSEQEWSFHNQPSSSWTVQTVPSDECPPEPEPELNLSGSVEIGDYWYGQAQNELLKIDPILPSSSFGTGSRGESYSNAFAISTWVKHMSGDERSYLVIVGQDGYPGAANTDYISIKRAAIDFWEFEIRVQGPSYALNPRLYRAYPNRNPTGSFPSGEGGLDRQLSEPIALDTWYQLTCSWDGRTNSFRIWVNGEEALPTPQFTFDTPAPTLEKQKDDDLEIEPESLRLVRLGPAHFGPPYIEDPRTDANTDRIYSIAMFSDALTDADAVAMYNGGLEFDLTGTTDGYTGSNILEHWHHFGLDPATFGLDSVTGNHTFVSSGATPITIDDDVVPDYPGGPEYNAPFTVNPNSVNLSGSGLVGKEFATQYPGWPGAPLIVSNNFTASAWVKPITGDRDTLYFSLVDQETDLIIALTQTERSGWKFEIYIGSPFVPKKSYLLDLNPNELNSTTLNSWYQITFTWDGSLDTIDGEPIRAWINGVEATSTGTPRLTKTSNATGLVLPVFTIPNLEYSEPSINAGNIFGRQNDDIYYYSLAMWSSTLSATEAAAIYNGGEELRLDADGTGYSSSESLTRWYRFGFDERDLQLGKQYPTDVELMISDGAEDITISDLVQDIPTSSP